MTMISLTHDCQKRSKISYAISIFHWKKGIRTKFQNDSSILKFILARSLEKVISIGDLFSHLNIWLPNKKLLFQKKNQFWVGTRQNSDFQLDWRSKYGMLITFLQMISLVSLKIQFYSPDLRRFLILKFRWNNTRFECNASWCQNCQKLYSWNMYAWIWPNSHRFNISTSSYKRMVAVLTNRWIKSKWKRSYCKYSKKTLKIQKRNSLKIF